MRTLDAEKLKLWPHQLAAVKSCESYFNSSSLRSALIHMPTGTGKTGIMATVATRRASTKPVLVVCPSVALVHQLIGDFSGAFWQKIGASRDWAPELNLHLLPSELDNILNQLANSSGNRAVVFATIQALQQIHSTEHYAKLHGNFGTVLFDEGHREPATLWAQAARGLGAQTVLFTATPFRNDLKIFDVDLDHTHFLSFRDAVTRNLIRGVEIHEKNLDAGPREFARAAIADRDALIARGHFSQANKMIIRADREEDVDALFIAFNKELKGRDDGVLGLHINFPNDGPVGRQRRPDVPTDLRMRPEKFLIHQFMLAEGIDDPACTMLGIYEPFSTERQLVQQIGRLTRHGGTIGKNISTAYVLARKGDEVRKMWSRFLSFDDSCVRNGGKPPVRNDEKILEKLIGALPDVDYIAGKFRARLDFDDIDLEQELRIPRSAVVFDVEPGFLLDDFEAEVLKGLQDVDRFVRKSDSVGAGGCRFHVSLRLVPSPFLAEALFLTPSLDLTIYAQHGNRLFFYDSAGLWIDNTPLRDRSMVGPLRTLLPDAADARVTSMTMKNTDLGPLAIKSRSMSAQSLATSGVFMGEHLHVITRAAGRVGKTRRAVAFARSRIREGDGAKWTPAEFWEWTKSVDGEMKTGAKSATIFRRFAAPVKPPKVIEPTNILIDLEELADDFVDESGSLVEFDFEHACIDIVSDAAGPKGYRHRFGMTVGGVHFEVWIKWDPKKRKFWLRSDALSEYKLRDNERVSLARRINQKQPFRIIIENSSTVYAYGGFYAIDLDLSRSGGPGSLILNLVEAVAGLEAVTSEKGALSAPANTWPRESLFGFIDRALAPAAANRAFGEKFPVLVCDDLGDEVADFIGIDDGAATPRVAFIAAKWKAGKAGVSASAVYDVCAQALKNLVYLKADGQHLPGNGQKWGRDWLLSGGRVPRIRAGAGAAAIRGALVRTRANPGSQRVTWLVLGGGILSRTALRRELGKSIPEPHVLQFVHLVLSAYATCQSIGSDLRIFCAP